MQSDSFENSKVFRITMTALMAALSYIAFAYIRVRIPLPNGDATSIHLGNAVCALGALLLGGVYGGLGGAIGMSLGDLFDPVYIYYVPKTIILKMLIGLITGFIAHRIGHITESTDKRHILRFSAIASGIGLGFNVIADPTFGYFYKRVFLNKTAAELSILPEIGSCTINAISSFLIVVAVYNALIPALKKAGLFIKVGQKV